MIMNIDEQIEYIEEHLKYLRCYPSSNYVLDMHRSILKTLKEVKEAGDIVKAEIEKWHEMHKSPTDLEGKE